jgi:hypothetical protein
MCSIHSGLEASRLPLPQIRSVQRHLTFQAWSISLIDMITLLLGIAAAVMKSRQALILENLTLRHQIGVLRRSVKQRLG